MDSVRHLDGQLSLLPAGWTLVKLGDISIIGAGGPAPQGSEYFEDGKYSFVRVQDMGNLDGDIYVWDTRDHINDKAIQKLKLFRTGTVLFTKSGMSTLLNQRAILAKDMYIVSHIGTAIPLGEIPSEWIFYFLKIVDFKDLTHATTLPSLRLPKVKNLDIPLPPLPEQHHIVAKIEELFTKLDAGVVALKKIKAQLKRYRQAVLKHAFEGKLTAEWREKHKDELEPASILLERIKEELKKKGKCKKLPQIETSDLSKLPDGWIRIRLGNIQDIVDKVNPKLVPEKEFIYLDIASIDNTQQKIVVPKKYMGKNAPSRARQLIKTDDILFSTVRTYLKNIAMVEEKYNGQIASTGFCVIRPSKPIISKFVFYIAQTETFFNQLTQIQRGTSYPAVRDSDVFNQIVILPSVGEQQKIVDEIERYLSVADVIEKTINQNLLHSEKLRSSILKRAFEGKLVKQDPSDEPAEKLLERIKVEKEK